MIQENLFGQGVSNGQPVSSEPVVIVEHATASYGTHRALEDISLSLFPGEIYVLLGPNGAGKSSLVRLLTGSLQPKAGSVRVLTGSSGFSGINRQTLSLVPQDIALYPWLTATENCWAFARASGLRRRDAMGRANHMLALTGCETVADTLAGRLSGGYKRRVNIAAALVNHPRLLILDEPTVGVDLGAKQAINATIKALGDTGISILLITHDFETADTLASRVGFLKKGKLVCEGVPSKLIKSEFRDSKQIEIYFAAPPSLEQVAVLRAEGALPGGSSTIWHIFKPISRWDGSHVLSSLEEKGVKVKELRLRDPGLETLYNLFCDENREI
jgi:ABC-2 type transport system ATP-binding protein